jgi:two-component system nitrogen regulation sensor histidine kinase GlnL
VLAAPVSNSSTADSGHLLDSLVAPIAVLDAALRFVYINAAFSELFGTVAHTGSPLSALGDAVPVLMEAIEHARAASGLVAVRAQFLPVRGDQSVPADIFAAMQNDLALADPAIVLEIHTRVAEPDATMRVSHSLRGLAHEVKNPLAGLRGAAQLLKRRLLDADQTKLADLIIAEADRLAALTDRLLQPAGKPHLSVINLHEVAERARALMVAEAAPELALDRDYDPSLPTLRGVGDRLLQLLLNLLRNAMQAGAKSILVRTRAVHGAMLGERAVRLALRLDVIDDGPGVPEHLRETLFLPLVSGRADGTGLGLALAQEIAQEHGGQLTCRSRPGRTVFSLTLPVETAHA